MKKPLDRLCVTVKDYRYCLRFELQEHHTNQAHYKSTIMPPEDAADVSFAAQQESFYFFTELAASHEHGVMPQVRIEDQPGIRYFLSCLTNRIEEIFFTTNYQSFRFYPAQTVTQVKAVLCFNFHYPV